MTYLSIMAASSLRTGPIGRSRIEKLRLHQSLNLLLRESITLEFFDQRPHALLCLSHSVRSRFLRTAPGHVRARAMSQLEQPFVLQLGIRFDDCVGTDDELLRKSANAGKSV